MPKLNCSTEGCNNFIEVKEACTPNARFFCPECCENRRVVKKALGINNYDPEKDEDKKARFADYAFDHNLGYNQGPDRDGDSGDPESSGGIVDIPFDYD